MCLLVLTEPLFIDRKAFPLRTESSFLPVSLSPAVVSLRPQPNSLGNFLHRFFPRSFHKTRRREQERAGARRESPRVLRPPSSEERRDIDPIIYGQELEREMLSLSDKRKAEYQVCHKIPRLDFLLS